MSSCRNFSVNPTNPNFIWKHAAMLPHCASDVKYDCRDGNLLWKGGRWARGCGHRQIQGSVLQPGLLWCHSGSSCYLREVSLTHCFLLVGGLNSFVHLVNSMFVRLWLLSFPSRRDILSFPTPCLSPSTSEDLPGRLYQSCHFCLPASPLWCKAAEPTCLLVSA